MIRSSTCLICVPYYLILWHCERSYAIAKAYIDIDIDMDMDMDIDMDMDRE